MPFGIIYSPLLLEGTLSFHLLKEGSHTAKVICDNIYVDNVCVGANSMEEALHLDEEAKNIFSCASMNLHECSNSDKFLFIIYLRRNSKVEWTDYKSVWFNWNRIKDYIQIPSFKVSLGEYDITK